MLAIKMCNSGWLLIVVDEFKLALMLLDTFTQTGDFAGGEAVSCTTLDEVGI
jgi:hypothetical protein